MLVKVNLSIWLLEELLIQQRLLELLLKMQLLLAPIWLLLNAWSLKRKSKRLKETQWVEWVEWAEWAEWVEWEACIDKMIIV